MVHLILKLTSRNVVHGAVCFAAGAASAFLFVLSFGSSMGSTEKESFMDLPQVQIPVNKTGCQVNTTASTTIPVNERRVDLPAGFCRTSSTGYEILLESFMGALFAEEGLLPSEGGVLDVGAQFGENACHFARLAPERTVHALDPSPTQCASISSKFASKLPNLHVTNAGVGKEVGEGQAGEGFTGMAPGDVFRIETIDNIFFDKGEKLAFVHIDVEGRELDVLRGGSKSIAANKPIFTAELRVHKDPDFSVEMLDYINEIGYDAYVVDEPCGWPHMDYRNLINFPRSMMKKLVHSDAFNQALFTEVIFPVNSKTIFSKVYPCCALGEECCRYNSTSVKGCCREDNMRKWHSKNNVYKPIALQGFTYSKKYVMNTWKDLYKREKMTPEQAIA